MSPAELVTIAIVALVVFGPQRLPEIARRAGRVIRDVRNAASEFRSSIEREYGDTIEPLDRARRELSTGLDRTPPAEKPADDDRKGPADGA